MLSSSILQKYMLTDENMNIFSGKNKENMDLNETMRSNNNIIVVRDSNKYKYKEKEKDVVKEVKEVKEVKDKKNKVITSKYYNIKQTDTLFWCFYIMKYGVFKYEMEIRGTYFTVEKDEKYKCVEVLRKSKDKLKMYKIKPFTDLEYDLTNNSKISEKTFIALCICFDLNIMLIDKRKVYEYLFKDDIIFIVHKNKFNDYYMEDATDNVIQIYKNTYCVMSSINDKLKSISSYKLAELKDLCVKHNLLVNNTEKSQTKQALYDLLITCY